MFTGLIQQQGLIREVLNREGGCRLKIAFDHKPLSFSLGSSIAVNGVCVTIVELSDQTFSVDVVAQTLSCTTFDTLVKGSRVNLESPLRFSDGLEGHLVTGHVDDTGSIVAIDSLPDGSVQITIELPSALSHYVIKKGSIAIEGISLTVAQVEEEQITLALIPHTLSVTTLGEKSIGDRVNVEVDMMAKYIEKLLPTHQEEATYAKIDY